MREICCKPRFPRCMGLPLPAMCSGRRQHDSTPPGPVLCEAKPATTQYIVIACCAEKKARARPNATADEARSHLCHLACLLIKLPITAGSPEVAGHGPVVPNQTCTARPARENAGASPAGNASLGTGASFQVDRYLCIPGRCLYQNSMCANPKKTKTKTTALTGKQPPVEWQASYNLSDLNYDLRYGLSSERKGSSSFLAVWFGKAEGRLTRGATLSP